jgi:2-polyprenyl-6-methoxyphenol hydroxylase-like FAD-dependent oxidoreductase
MTKPKRNPRILISGAGIAGPSLAFRLLRHGFEPTLIERAPSFRESGYMIDVWGLGYDLLERFGLLEKARERAYVFDRLTIVDDHDKEIARFGGEVFRRALLGRFFSIPRGDLARTIHDTIEGQVETLYGTSIRALHDDPGGVDAELVDGSTRRFDLVVGAEGLRSHMRELAFGAEAEFEHYLGYCAASFIAADYPHRTEAAYVSHARPGRQISRYAMRGGRTAFLLVFADDDKRNAAAHDLASQKSVLNAKFGGDGWESAEILSRLDAADELYFDAVSQIRMPKWSRGRIALVGDAAHSPSLLAGAGATYAMLGAYVLAGELNEAMGDHVQAFAAYEQRLRPFILREQDAAASLARSFTPKTSLGLFVRNSVLNLMNIPPIGAWLTRRMLGGTFILPDYC